MQAFHFRLEKVLDWYRRQHELEERRFAACLAALAETQRAIAALQAERLEVEREVLSRTSIAARELAALVFYRLRVKKRELELNETRTRCEAGVREQRARLQAAERRVRLVEKLRERRLSDHDYAEARELEELAADAYFSKWATRG